MSERLEGEGLEKRFARRPVVRGVDLGVARGEVVGLLGPNGAGKTTCFGMLTGLLRPDRGVIRLEGREVTRAPLHRRARLGVSYLPQEPSVFRGLSVVENLLVVLEASSMPARERRTLAGQLLEEVGLASLSGQSAQLLSGGERRRLEIARVLALEPRFALLDEPFAGIDPMGIAELKRWVRTMAERGIGVLVTDHNVRECLKICDRAYLLHDGRVLAEGAPKVLAADPLVREVYLGAEFELG